MTTLITDTFGRADESPIGAPYAGPASGITGRLKITANKAGVVTASADSWAYHNVTYPSDHWAQVTVGTVGGSDFGPVLRVSTTGNGYLITPSGGAAINLLKVLAGGGFTALASGGAGYVAGDVIYAEVQGNTIVVKQNGTTIITFTDSSSPITGGQAGMGGFDGTFRISAFSAGDFLSLVEPAGSTPRPGSKLPGRGPLNRGSRTFNGTSNSGLRFLRPSNDVYTPALSTLSPLPQNIAEKWRQSENRPGRGPYSLGAYYRLSVDVFTPLSGGTSAALAAALQNQTTLIAALSTQIALASTTAAQCTVSAALSTAIPLAAAAANVATLTAALSTQVQLAVNPAGQCTVTAALTTAITLQAAAQGVTTLGATLSGGGALMAATPAAQCTVSAALSTAIPLAAQAQCVTTVSASIAGNAALLQAQASSRCNVTAALSTSIALASQVIANAQATAALSTQIQMLAAVQGAVSLAATFVVPIIQGSRTTPQGNNTLTRPRASTIRRR